MARKPSTKLPHGAVKGRRGKALEKKPARRTAAAPVSEQDKEIAVAELPAAEASFPTAPATIAEPEAPKQRKKPGPKPGARKASAKKPAAEEEQKVAPVKAEKKEAPAKPSTKETVLEAVYVQYAGGEADVADVLARAKADYLESHKKTNISSIKVFLKPDEKMAYYVINESGFGKVSMK